MIPQACVFRKEMKVAKIMNCCMYILKDAFLRGYQQLLLRIKNIK